MDTLRTSVSYLGTTETAWGGEPADRDLDRAMNMLAKIPTMIATDYRFRKGMKRIAPRKDLTMSENFFHMCFGKVPPREVIRAFDISLILYAEHSFNASTFTARVITSSRSDIYSAVTGGIGSLRSATAGRTSGHAQFDRYQNAGACREMAARQTANKELVMGFGHRVYKQEIPASRQCALPSKTLRLGRATPSGWRSQTFSRHHDQREGYSSQSRSRRAPPTLMGFEIDMYTPIFVMSRITGWSAHILEQNASNSLIRPLSAYGGVKQRKVKSISKRVTTFLLACARAVRSGHGASGRVPRR